MEKYLQKYEAGEFVFAQLLFFPPWPAKVSRNFWDRIRCAIFFLQLSDNRKFPRDRLLQSQVLRHQRRRCGAEKMYFSLQSKVQRRLRHVNKLGEQTFQRGRRLNRARDCINEEV